RIACRHWPGEQLKPKELSFLGDGTATANEVDKAKWVPGTDCSVSGALGIADDGETATVFPLYYFPLTGFTARSIAFLEEAAGTYNLCYQFRNEPFKLYENLQLTVLEIISVTTAVGEADIIVVNQEKQLIFGAGGGLGIEMGDVAFWVNPVAATDADCLIETYHSGPRATLDAAGAGSFFVTPEQAEGEWKLCYTFRGETTKIYPNFTLRAYSLTEIDPLQGASYEAVVAFPKVFQLSGSRVAGGDSAKWVLDSAQVDADCEDVPPAEDAEASEEEEGAAAEPQFSVVDESLQVSFTFAQATQAGSTLVFCYRHGVTEQWKLFPDLHMSVKELVSVKQRALGTTNTLSAILGMPQPLAFVGFGVAEGDRARWVLPSELGCEESTASDGVASGWHKEALFTPPVEGEYSLCYGFGVEPLVPYPAITLTVVPPVINKLTGSLVAGAATDTTLTGTFGLTAGDALFAAPSSASSCVGLSQTADLVHPTLSDGGAAFALTVEERTLPSQPLKLCYRFGDEHAPFQLFDRINWEVYEVSEATLVQQSGQGFPVVLTIAFGGTGVADGDVAKYVSAAVTSDDQCAAAAGVVGSSPAVITGQEADFTMADEVTDWVLCYKHFGHPWRLYAELGVKRVAEEVETVSVTQKTQAKVTVSLPGDLDAFPEGSAARDTLVADFKNDLIGALGVDPSRVQITGLESGSIVVTFIILPSASIADSSTAEVLADLALQAEDPASPLRQGTLTSQLKDLGVQVEIQEEAPEVDTTVDVAVVDWQPKGLFELSSAEYVTTEASGSVAITINRSHSSSSRVGVTYLTVADGTATAGQDFVHQPGKLVYFEDSETSKTVQVYLVDDLDREAHFETFSVSLALLPAVPGAMLGPQATASIHLYDYGDGTVLESSSFSSESTDLDGWSVLGNGGEGGTGPWLDPTEGLGCSDAVFGEEEWDAACDYAATAPCGFDCQLGDGLHNLDGTVTSLDGTAVLQEEGVVCGGGEAFSVSFWIKTTGTNPEAVLLTYGQSQVVLSNPSSVSLLIRDNRIQSQDRYDGPDGGDRRGILTGINVADSNWHFVAVGWRTSDGRVQAFLDGTRVFEGGPYRQGATLQEEGTVLVGESLSARLAQLRLWTRFLTPADISHQMGPASKPFTGSTVGMCMYWPLAGEERFEATVITDMPSINPAFPCGDVYSGIWFWRLPVK
ncbi:unnamed protein product, partial [Chrysoparadoxa australica]